MAERRADDETPRRAPQRAKYVVQQHDTLPSIAERVGHPGEWQALWEANRELVPDANVIFLGTELTLPDGWIW